MEELRSVEALESAIRAGSLESSQQILAKANSDAENILHGVENRAEEAAAQFKEKSRVLLEEERRFRLASLPLEKERARVSFIRESVLDAVGKYLEALDTERVLLALRIMLEKHKTPFEGKRVLATVISIDIEKARRMLESVFGDAVQSCVAANGSEVSRAGLFPTPGVILKTEDLSVTFRLTLAEKIAEILDERAAELANTLFCGRLPE